MANPDRDYRDRFMSQGSAPGDRPVQPHENAMRNTGPDGMFPPQNTSAFSDTSEEEGESERDPLSRESYSAR
jgi:hypothetical protein